jgi:hypothetical protein
MNPALEGNKPKMTPAAARDKPGFIHIPAFMGASSAIMRASAARMGGALTPLQIRRHHRACPGDPRLASYFS